MILLQNKNGSISKFHGEIVKFTPPLKFSHLENFTSDILIQINASKINLISSFHKRIEEVSQILKPVILYSNFFREKRLISPPEFSKGSVRDNFYFGELLYFNVKKFKKLLTKYEIENPHEFPPLYMAQLLSILENESVFKIKEPLYILEEKKSEDNHFNYTYREIEYQKKCEKILNLFLKKIGAYIKSTNTYTVKNRYPVMASVIIPVKNREKTIGEAVESALSQKTSFEHNVIVVNNHSTDKTGEILEGMSRKYKNLIHIIPGEKYLNIGGCWQLAISNENCGEYAIQLDSDDIYSHQNVLEEMVSRFEEKSCGMVVGSYMVVDFNLNPIIKEPIMHREWSEENGHNNLLRVNGIGAPRGYVTEILREEFSFPDVGYGEDYAVSLAISGKYKVERIYKNLYLCRRWGENTDSKIDENKLYRFDEYKDQLRHIEIKRRIKRNSDEK